MLAEENFGDTYAITRSTQRDEEMGDMRDHLYNLRFKFADTLGQVGHELVAALLVGQAGTLAFLVGGIVLSNGMIALL
jgi:hypothetical protein